MGADGSKWIVNGCYGTLGHTGTQKRGTKRHEWARTDVHVTSMGVERGVMCGFSEGTWMGCRWLCVDVYACV